MSQRICRWGILSTASIGRKNWHGITASKNARLVAVASRSEQKAQEFIDSCQASAPAGYPVTAVGSYEELLARDDIDAVYIPLPTGLRKDWVLKAANAGKHVMVEKPCGVELTDVQTMVDACKANNVQFMDGVMFMHSQRLRELRRTLDDGNSVGEIRRITSQFSFCGDDEFLQQNIRTTSSLEPAGCLGDLGWYTIRATLWAMKYEMPVEVRGRILNGVQRTDSPNQVPLEFQGELHFASGVSASFYNSFRGHNQQWLNISGSKGYVQLNDFVLPFYGPTVGFDVCNHEFTFDGCRFNMEERTQPVRVPEYSNNAATAQETNQFTTFSQLVLDGKTDEHWPNIALKTQAILDAALESARNNGAAVSP